MNAEPLAKGARIRVRVPMLFGVRPRRIGIVDEIDRDTVQFHWEDFKGDPQECICLACRWEVTRIRASAYERR